MNARAQRQSSRNERVAGFSLVEALVSFALMGLIVAALSVVTGQWAPNSNRGFVHVQRLESVDVGLQRLVSDLGACPDSVRRYVDLEGVGGSGRGFRGSFGGLTGVRRVRFR